MTEYIKEMVYSANRIDPKRIAEGTYKGLDYYVLNLGTHPCAYIDVTETLLNGKEYGDIDVKCHGGLTYSRNYLTTVDKHGWFIGWDYAHDGDFAGYEMMFPSNLQSDGKHWATGEIVDECKNVIDQIVGLPKQTNIDRIKAMNVEEMAEWLSDMFDCNDCAEHERLSDNPLSKDERCDQKCVEHCKEWLVSEVKRT